MDERIIDTCSLLNLFASGQHKSILNYFGGISVSEHVQREALWIREFDEESPPRLVPKQIDLKEYIDEGVISVCQLETEGERDLYVHLAQSLDDGEASVLAIAKCRDWTVATDDKKASKLAAEHGIVRISTSEMIRKWSDAYEIGEEEIGLLLLDIQRFGRFAPPRTDANYEWWIEQLNRAID